MDKVEEIDAEFKKEITCPYCGYEMMDSWELNPHFNAMNQQDIECDECSKSFIAEIDYDITYSSYKKEGESNE